MIRLEPTGRGAEPQVSTTVASATPRPALRQSSAALRISSSRASELMFASITLASIIYPLRAQVACAGGGPGPSPARDLIPGAPYGDAQRLVIAAPVHEVVRGIPAQQRAIPRPALDDRGPGT